MMDKHRIYQYLKTCDKLGVPRKNAVQVLEKKASLTAVASFILNALFGASLIHDFMTASDEKNQLDRIEKRMKAMEARSKAKVGGKSTSWGMGQLGGTAIGGLAGAHYAPQILTSLSPTEASVAGGFGGAILGNIVGKKIDELNR